MIGILDRIRHWWRGDTVKCEVKCSLAPHERYPEILHWRKGDQFGESFSYQPHYELIALSEDGWALVVRLVNQRKDAVPIKRLLDCGNRSLKERRIDEALQGTAEYMELIEQFNYAFAELQERDNKLKLVG